jgi:lipoyl(octanoyl) transferase
MKPWPAPRWLGRVSYPAAWWAQRTRRSAVLEGAADEAIWLLEHDAVYTTGLRAVDLPEVLPAPVVRTERGGLTTWHGPGQLVGYLILDISGRGGSVKGTLAAVEAGVIAWLGGHGIDAGRRPGFPGVWVGRDKICAVGMHFRRGVSMHGLALNLSPDLSAFDAIVPCGITDGGVTSFAEVRGSAPTPAQAAIGLGQSLVCALGERLTGSEGLAT